MRMPEEKHARFRSHIWGCPGQTMRNSFLSGENIGELPDPGNATDIPSADSPYENRLQSAPHKKTAPTRPDRSHCLPWRITPVNHLVQLRSPRLPLQGVHFKPGAPTGTSGKTIRTTRPQAPPALYMC
jgi:hypothetical protein